MNGKKYFSYYCGSVENGVKSVNRFGKKKKEKRRSRYQAKKNCKGLAE